MGASGIDANGGAVGPLEGDLGEKPGRLDEDLRQIKSAWRVRYRRLDGLKKTPGNPRSLGKRQFADLCVSLKSNPGFFEARPLILSDRTGELVIIAGNMKAEAAKINGLVEVPTVLLSGLSEEQEREIIIRDNAHAGEWDYDVLANEWSDLPLEEWGVQGIPKSRDASAETAVREVDVSEVRDQFWMSVTGPLPAQREALKRPQESLEQIPGVEVSLGSTVTAEGWGQ